MRSWNRCGRSSWPRTSKGFPAPIPRTPRSPFLICWWPAPLGTLTVAQAIPSPVCLLPPPPSAPLSGQLPVCADGNFPAIPHPAAMEPSADCFVEAGENTAEPRSLHTHTHTHTHTHIHTHARGLSSLRSRVHASACSWNRPYTLPQSSVPLVFACSLCVPSSAIEMSVDDITEPEKLCPLPVVRTDFLKVTTHALH